MSEIALPPITRREALALHADLNESHYGNPVRRATRAVMSEFDRRLRENSSPGCDHGHRSAMIVSGGQVNGGRLYGPWSGLRNDQRFDRADLAVTPDDRSVLREILARWQGNGRLDVVFPEVTVYSPLLAVQGPDIPVRLTPASPRASLGNEVFPPVVCKSNCLP